MSNPLEDPALSDQEKKDYLRSQGGYVSLPDDDGQPEWVTNPPQKGDPRFFLAILSDGSGVARLYTNFDEAEGGERRALMMLLQRRSQHSESHRGGSR